MAIGLRLGLVLGLWLPGFMYWLGLGFGPGLGFYFAAVLHNFLQFYAFRIAQLQNGYRIKIKAKNSGYIQGYG